LEIYSINYHDFSIDLHDFVIKNIICDFCPGIAVCTFSLFSSFPFNLLYLVPTLLTFLADISYFLLRVTPPLTPADIPPLQG
jgi:hypothetical protein